jgi:hypothetical protein
MKGHSSGWVMGLIFTYPVAYKYLVIGRGGPNPIPDGAAVRPKLPSSDFLFKSRMDGPEKSGAQQSGIELKLENQNRFLWCEFVCCSYLTNQNATVGVMNTEINYCGISFL